MQEWIIGGAIFLLFALTGISILWILIKYTFLGYDQRPCTRLHVKVDPKTETKFEPKDGWM